VSHDDLLQMYILTNRIKSKYFKFNFKINLKKGFKNIFRFDNNQILFTLNLKDSDFVIKEFFIDSFYKLENLFLFFNELTENICKKLKKNSIVIDKFLNVLFNNEDILINLQEIGSFWICSSLNKNFILVSQDICEFFVKVNVKEKELEQFLKVSLIKIEKIQSIMKLWKLVDYSDFKRLNFIGKFENFENKSILELENLEKELENLLKKK
jgi:hypothetical protein